MSVVLVPVVVGTAKVVVVSPLLGFCILKCLRGVVYVRSGVETIFSVVLPGLALFSIVARALADITLKQRVVGEVFYEKVLIHFAPLTCASVGIHVSLVGDAYPEIPIITVACLVLVLVDMLNKVGVVHK